MPVLLAIIFFVIVTEILKRTTVGFWIDIGAVIVGIVLIVAIWYVMAKGIEKFLLLVFRIKN